MIRSKLGRRESRALDPTGTFTGWNDSLQLTGVVPPHGFDFLNRAGVNVTPKTILSIGVVQRCLLPGTEVITKRGVVSIESVVVGDEVLTHRRRWRPVTEIMANLVEDRPVVDVSAHGVARLSLTADHRMWAAHYHSVAPGDHRELDGFGWKPAGDMISSIAGRRRSRRIGFDAVCLPAPSFEHALPALNVAAVIGLTPHNGMVSTRPDSGPGGGRAKPIPATVRFSAALGRIIGWYLAEGSNNNDTVTFSLGPSEHQFAEQIAADVESVFGLAATIRANGPTSGAGISIQVCSQPLAALLTCGTARTKTVPSWAWDGNAEFMGAMFDAWFQGDGSRYLSGRNHVYPRCVGNTSSKSLAWQMRLVGMGLGLAVSLQNKPARTGWIPVRGKTIDSSESFRLEWREKPQTTGRHHIEEGFLVSPVDGVESHPYEGLVYNLEVADDHSYTTTGGIVHNCLEVIQNAFFVMGRPRPYRIAWDKDGFPYRQWIPGSSAAYPALLNAPWGTTVFADNAAIPYNVGIGKTTLSMGLFGEAWWLATARDYYGNVSALEPLHPAFIIQRTNGDQTKLESIWYGMGAKMVELDPADLVHIPRLIIPGDRSGISPVKQEAPIFAIAIAAVQYSQMWFAQGGQPSFILSTDKKLGQDEIDRIFEHLLLEHSGLQKAYTPLILDMGVKPEITQLDPEKSQMTETLQYVRSEITGYFGIPAHLAGGTGDTGNVWGKGIQEENFSLIDFTFSGYKIPIEEAFTQVTPRGQFVGIDERRLLRANSLDTSRTTLANRTAGKTTQNEERRADELPPLPGGDNLNAPLNSNAPAVGPSGAPVGALGAGESSGGEGE